MRRWAMPLLLLFLLVFARSGPTPAAELFGPGFAPCGDQPSTPEIVLCVDAKARAWDARLNAACAALQRRIEPGQREPLRTAQRLWIGYRDANCRFYAAQEGTIRQTKAAECLRAMTEARTLELERAMVEE